MTTEQITAAMTGQDTDDKAKLIEALRGASDDQMIALLEEIRDAVRKDTVTDVLVDLKDAGEVEAAEFIKENY